MRALLIQHECEAALEVLPVDMEAQAKAELNKKAHSAVILCLALTLEDVMATLNLKEIKERSKAKGDDGEGLYVRGRTDRRDSHQNCPKNNRKKSSGYVNKDDQPSSSGLIYDGFEVMMVMSVEALLDWIMDLGGSYHMTPRLDLFFDFLECDGGMVLLGDNRECKIRCIGKLRVQLKDGLRFVLQNVRYIPELKRNLISMGTLKKEGYTVKLQSSKIKVINGSRIVLSRTRRDNCVYSLDGHAVAGELNDSVEENDSLAYVWHKRLGHISEVGLQVLEKQGLFGKKSLGSDRLCSFRIIGFVSGGIIRRFKHKEFEMFKEWKQLVKNQTGRTVKKLRTDNGLEFYNREFKQLCIESGIARHLTVARTLQQNGLAERMNRTLMDKFHVQRHVEGFWCSRLNNHTLEEDQTDNKDQTNQDDGDDEDVGDQEINQPPDLTNYQLVWDREPRKRTKPLRFREESNMAAYAFTAAEEEDTHEPLTYQEVISYEDSSKWKATMKEEMDSFRKNKTWELVDHQARQKLVTCKWLFKIKEGIEGVQKPRYKVRLVACGFTQRAHIDYNEVFSPVVRQTSIRIILALTACKDFELEQLDVKTTFLHGNLEEVTYMRQPLGYEQGNNVCLLKKSLYGLKQSPRQWYRRFDEYMLSNGFKRSYYDICVYYRSYAPGGYIYLLLYVDDMLIAFKSKAEIGSTKSLLKKEFDMKDLGEAKKILGMEIVRDRSRKILRVSQSGYVSNILNNYRIDNGKSVQMPLGGHFKLLLKDCPIKECDVEGMSKVPYVNAVGSLMYLMVYTRPDIAYAVSIVSRYLANPGKSHWEAVKWILKYLRGTTNVGLVYGTNRGNHMDVTGFVDSDYAKDPNKVRSITGYEFLVHGCVVSWKETLQHVVAFSTTEAEYIALTEAMKEAIWLRGLLEELGAELNRVTVNCDNQGAIHLSRNHVFHERTKHIIVRYHFIREVWKQRQLKF
nr:retrotransposon protein, putative, Ty1-copia subclass [Tanacetum cinerariifolium]